MSVREVHMPGGKGAMDPKNMKPQDSAIDWEKKAAEMESRSKYALAAKELETLENPPPPNASDAGVKIKGDIDIGHIDLMEQSRNAQTKMEEIQKRYEEQITGLSAQSESDRDKITELRLQMMQSQFNVQLEALTARLTAGQGNQPSFGQQLEMIKAQAGLLGLQSVPASVTDASLQLQILKMNNDSAREDREFQWKLKQYDLEREMRLQEVKENNSVAMEQVKVERERNNMLASGFEAIGAAIARGIIDAGQSRVSDQPQSPAGPPREFRIEAGVGQQGEVNCPGCGNPVAVLADTQSAVCATCGARLPVTRIAANRTPPQNNQLAPEEAERAG